MRRFTAFCAMQSCAMSAKGRITLLPLVVELICKIAPPGSERSFHKSNTFFRYLNCFAYTYFFTGNALKKFKKLQHLLTFILICFLHHVTWKVLEWYLRIGKTSKHLVLKCFFSIHSKKIYNKFYMLFCSSNYNTTSQGRYPRERKTMTFS